MRTSQYFVKPAWMSALALCFSGLASNTIPAQAGQQVPILGQATIAGSSFVVLEQGTGSGILKGTIGRMKVDTSALFDKNITSSKSLFAPIFLPLLVREPRTSSATAQTISVLPPGLNGRRYSYTLWVTRLDPKEIQPGIISRVQNNCGIKLNQLDKQECHTAEQAIGKDIRKPLCEGQFCEQQATIEQLRLDKTCKELESVKDFILSTTDSRSYTNSISRLFNAYNCGLVNSDQAFSLLKLADQYLQREAKHILPPDTQREQVYQLFGYVYSIDSQKYATLTKPSEPKIEPGNSAAAIAPNGRSITICSRSVASFIQPRQKVADVACYAINKVDLVVQAVLSGQEVETVQPLSAIGTAKVVADSHLVDVASAWAEKPSSVANKLALAQEYLRFNYIISAKRLVETIIAPKDDLAFQSQLLYTRMYIAYLNSEFQQVVDLTSAYDQLEDTHRLLRSLALHRLGKSEHAERELLSLDQTPAVLVARALVSYERDPSTNVERPYRLLELSVNRNILEPAALNNLAILDIVTGNFQQAHSRFLRLNQLIASNLANDPNTVALKRSMLWYICNYRNALGYLNKYKLPLSTLSLKTTIPSLFPNNQQEQKSNISEMINIKDKQNQKESQRLQARNIEDLRKTLLVGLRLLPIIK